jgi:hypothetical protein
MNIFLCQEVYELAKDLSDIFHSLHRTSNKLLGLLKIKKKYN